MENIKNKIRVTLNTYPFLYKCFNKYTNWILDNITEDNYLENDFINALYYHKEEELTKLQNLLLESKTILNINDSEFINIFGFNNDLLNKEPEKIHDLIIEPLVVINLHNFGFTEIKKRNDKIPENGKNIPIADFTAMLFQYKFAIEIKTIRIENNPKTIPGVSVGYATIPSWWKNMFINNVNTKIVDKNYKVIQQLNNSVKYLNCTKKMLVLYSRRLGPSTLMSNNDYLNEISILKPKYPEIDFFYIKDYFGTNLIYPELPKSII